MEADVSDEEDDEQPGVLMRGDVPFFAHAGCVRVTWGLISLLCIVVVLYSGRHPCVFHGWFLSLYLGRSTYLCYCNPEKIQDS